VGEDELDVFHHMGDSKIQKKLQLAMKLPTCELIKAAATVMLHISSIL